MIDTGKHGSAYGRRLRVCKPVLVAIVSLLFAAAITRSGVANAETIAPAERPRIADAASKASDGAAALTALPTRTTTDDGVPLSELIDVQVRNARLRIPAGYLAPWPTQAMRGRLNAVDSLNFNLWMPERRYPEVDPLLLKYELRPKEEGRPEQPSYAGVIQVRGLRPVELGEPGYASPEALFRKMTSLAGMESYSFESTEYGLDRFRENNRKRPPLYAGYRRQGADPQALVRCTPDEAAVREPICLADVFFAASGLGFVIQFPRYNLPDWLTIARSVRDLFGSWIYAVDPARKPLPSGRFDFHRYDAGEKDERMASATRDLNSAFPNGSDLYPLITSIIGQRGVCQRVLEIRETDKTVYKGEANIYCEVHYPLPNEHFSEIYITWIVGIGYTKKGNKIENVKVNTSVY